MTAGDMLTFAFEKSDAQEEYGSENVFSAITGSGRSLRFTAEVRALQHLTKRLFCCCTNTVVQLTSALTAASVFKVLAALHSPSCVSVGPKVFESFCDSMCICWMCEGVTTRAVCFAGCVWLKLPDGRPSVTAA